jgi:hypothetical protein
MQSDLPDIMAAVVYFFLSYLRIPSRKKKNCTLFDVWTRTHTHSHTHTHTHTHTLAHTNPVFFSGSQKRGPQKGGGGGGDRSALPPSALGGGEAEGKGMRLEVGVKEQ